MTSTSYERRSPTRVVIRSRQRVSPETDMFRKERRRKDLRVSTKFEPEGRVPSTPVTDASTPTPRRGSDDLRSPGAKKTPRVASSEEPIPDLITQTDAQGRATTPRSSTAIHQARKIHPSGPKPHLHVDKSGKLSEEDACTETILDSIRMMCCCFLGVSEEEETSPKREEKVLPQKPRLLPSIHPDDNGKKCLVLDLDETLVHSSFRAVANADFVIPVQIEDVVHYVYVIKRPGVDEFLTEMAKYYEIVIYTASLNKYADPLLDLLDPQKVIRTRLFRESCVYYEGNYVKDLSLLDRDLSNTIIIDNSPNSYIFHPENAIDCTSFIDDPKDRELNQIGDFLKGIHGVKDVRNICHQWREWPNVNLNTQ